MLGGPQGMQVRGMKLLNWSFMGPVGVSALTSIYRYEVIAASPNWVCRLRLVMDVTLTKAREQRWSH